MWEKKLKHTSIRIVLILVLSLLVLSSCTRYKRNTEQESQSSITTTTEVEEKNNTSTETITEVESETEDLVKLAQDTIWYDESSDRFRFPYHEGSEEWEKAPNVMARRELFEIPDIVLKVILTDNLLQLVSDYPYATDYIYYESFQDGFLGFCDGYPGAKELLEREDLGKSLLAKLEEEKWVSDDPDSTRHFLIYHSFAGQPCILDQLSDEEVIHLYDLVSDSWEEEDYWRKKILQMYEDSGLKEELRRRFVIVSESPRLELKVK